MHSLVLQGLCVLFSFSYPIAGAAEIAKPIIIDTDILTDVDDIGALAIANILHNCGFAELKGVAISTHSKYGAVAANAINTYFGNGAIPIAALRPLTNDTFFDTYRYTLGEFASKVAHNWPRTLNDSNSAPTPVHLYRSILSSAADQSITIITIGFLTNLADLLRSPPDHISEMPGSSLLATKVSELVVMGGRYPSGWEYNFGGVDPKSARSVIENWPSSVSITFSGYEFGKTIISGNGLHQNSPPDSPVLAAYEWYVGRCNTLRESWDPLTVLYGVLGLDESLGLSMGNPFKYTNRAGHNSIVAANGSNAWVDDERVTNQHWLSLQDNWTPQDAASLVDSFLTQNGQKLDCARYGPSRLRLVKDEL